MSGLLLHGNETLGSISGSDYQLVKNDSTPSSELLIFSPLSYHLH
jgi:hypothetical protein